MILDTISRQSGIPLDQMHALVRSANHHYKTYTVQKRTGGRRPISQPTPELKYLQRWMIRNLFRRLQIHPSAMAYRRGVGLQENAAMHARKQYLLRVDFQAFFPSLTGQDVRNSIVHQADRVPFDLDRTDLAIISKIVCRNERLTIGAPSSPILSNIIMLEFDKEIDSRCRDLDVVYTRYADDLYLSTDTPNVLADLYTGIRDGLRSRKSPRLRINENKTVFSSKKHRRLVTGLTLTSDGKVSIGREKKREIRTLAYRYTSGNLSRELVSYLSGFISYANAVEPSFVRSLVRKFGSDAIESLHNESIVPRK